MITQHDQIIIPLSKKKMFLTLLGSIVFVGVGLWFLTSPPETIHWLYGNSNFIFGLGLISAIFFGIIAVSMIQKISEKKAGLVINKQGVTDNSSALSIGFIPWADVQQIKVLKVMSERFLLFILNNPQDYLKKVKNPIRRNTMKINQKLYGSPFSISSNLLQINFDELKELLQKKRNEYKS